MTTHRIVAALACVGIGLASLTGCAGDEPDGPPTGVTADHPWYLTLEVTEADGGTATEAELADALASLTYRLQASGPADAYAFAPGTEGQLMVGFTEEPEAATQAALAQPIAMEFRTVWALGAADASAPDWTDAVDSAADKDALASAWSALDCARPAATDSADDAVVACSTAGDLKYVLGPMEGDSSLIADAVVQNQHGTDQVTGRLELVLTFTDEGAAWLGEISDRLGAQQGALGIVADGAVVAAPTLVGPISGGQAAISGAEQLDDAQLEQVVRAALGGYRLRIVSVEAIDRADG